MEEKCLFLCGESGTFVPGRKKPKKSENLVNGTQEKIQEVIAHSINLQDGLFTEKSKKVKESLGQKWHKDCRRSYMRLKTSKLGSKGKVNESNTMPVTKNLRSNQLSGDVSQKVCQFCLGDGKLKKVEDSKNTPFSKKEVIKNYCEFFPDSVVAKNLAGKDFILYETFFHRECLKKMYQQLVNKQRSIITSIKSLNPPDDPYAVLYEYVRDAVVGKGTCILLSQVYKAFQGKIDFPHKLVILKTHIQNHFGELVKFENHPNPSKGTMVYDGTITMASLLERFILHDTEEHLEEAVPKVAQTNHDLNKQVERYRTAICVHQELLQCKGLSIKEVVDADFSYEKAKELLPADTVALFEKMLGAEKVDEPGYSGPPKEVIVCTALNVVQIMASAVSIRSKHFPLQLAIARWVNAKLRSYNTIDFLAGFKLCSNYNTLNNLLNVEGKQMLSMIHEQAGVFVPTNIVARFDGGGFIILIIDNFDLNERTVDGKNTTHWVCWIMEQKNSDAHLETNASSKKIPILAKFDKMKSSEAFKHLESQSLKVKNYEGEKPSPTDVKKYLEVVFNNTKPKLSEQKKKHFLYVLLKQGLLSWLSGEEQGMPIFSVHKLKFVGWYVWQGMLYKQNGSKIPVSNLGTKEFLFHPITNIQTVRTAMLNGKDTLFMCGQKEKVMVGDEPVFSKMYAVRAYEPTNFSDFILLLGGFHFLLSFFGALGKLMYNTGLEWLMIESGVVGKTLVERGIFNNRHPPYELAVRSHVLMCDALEISRFRAFLRHQLKHNQLHFEQHKDKIKNIYGEIAEAVSKEETALLDKKMLNLESVCEELHHEYDNWVRQHATDEHPTFKLFTNYIELVTAFKGFITGQRIGDCDLYIESMIQLTYLLCAADHHKMSRATLLSAVEMMKVKENTSSELRKEWFEKKLFGVKLAEGTFNLLPYDLGLEKTAIKDNKGPGGVIGHSLQSSTTNRSILVKHFGSTRARMAEKMSSQNIARTEKNSSPWRSHADWRNKEVNDSVVAFVVDALENESSGAFSPWEVEGENAKYLLNIGCGHVFDKKTTASVNAIMDEGFKYCVDKCDRLSENPQIKFFDRWEKNAFTFPRDALKKKKNEALKNKLKESENTGKIDRMLMLVRERRDFQVLEQCLSHSCATYPFPFFQVNGKLRSKQKSLVLKWFAKKFGQPLKFPPPATNVPGFSRACVIDYLCYLRRIGVSNLEYYSDLGRKNRSDRLIDLESYRDLHLVMDEYSEKGQDKDGVRDERSGSIKSRQRLVIKGDGSKTRLPKCFNTAYLDSKFNKIECINFLIQDMITNLPREMPEGKAVYVTLTTRTEEGHMEVVKITREGVQKQILLQSKQQEADYRTCPHAESAAENNYRVVVRSTDTDTFLLFMQHGSTILGNDSRPGWKCRELYVEMLSGTNVKFYSIHEMLSSPNMNEHFQPLILPSHSLSGNDVNGYIKGHSKTKLFQFVYQNAAQFQVLKQLGDKNTPLTIESEVFKKIEELFMLMYVPKCVEEGLFSINKVRFYQYAYQFIPLQDVAPCMDTLFLHALRARRMCVIWMNALDPMLDPPDLLSHGYIEDYDGVVTAQHTRQEPLPLLIRNALSQKCNCKKGKCDSRRCRCFKDNRNKCTPVCGCSVTRCLNR